MQYTHGVIINSILYNRIDRTCCLSLCTVVKTFIITQLVGIQQEMPHNLINCIQTTETNLLRLGS